MNKSTHNSLLHGKLDKITTYQAGAMQASTHRLLQKQCDKILKPYGITKMQWLIIGAVLDGGPKGVRITDVSDKLDTTISYLTTTINLLESKGMLQRRDNYGDNRSKLIYINAKFAPKCVKIENTLRGALKKSIYSHIDPAEFRIYMKVLYQLSKVGDKITK